MKKSSKECGNKHKNEKKKKKTKINTKQEVIKKQHLIVDEQE